MLRTRIATDTIMVLEIRIFVLRDSSRDLSNLFVAIGTRVPRMQPLLDFCFYLVFICNDPEILKVVYLREFEISCIYIFKNIVK